MKRFPAFLVSIAITANSLAFPVKIFAADALCGDTSINTALGCLSVFPPSRLISNIFKWAVGISGAIALIILVYAGILMLASQGDAKRVKAAQELLTAAISGIILIILAVIILNFIGINLLDLGGLGFNV